MDGNSRRCTCAWWKIGLSKTIAPIRCRSGFEAIGDYESSTSRVSHIPPSLRLQCFLSCGSQTGQSDAYPFLTYPCTAWSEAECSDGGWKFASNRRGDDCLRRDKLAVVTEASVPMAIHILHSQCRYPCNLPLPSGVVEKHNNPAYWRGQHGIASLSHTKSKNQIRFSFHKRSFLDELSLRSCPRTTKKDQQSKAV